MLGQRVKAQADVDGLKGSAEDDNEKTMASSYTESNSLDLSL